ncbi:MAG: hypothetical protein P8P74_04780 [Crocinitomicaceae bacterium]|nr:hypothetical protein [Crocinitomicaceae bacterium]
MKHIVTVIFLFSSFFGLSQQHHLEVGAKVGFKDEFHLNPSFDLNSKYTEIHFFEAYFFGRVSKRRFGNELGIGLEKTSDYFVRYTDNSKEFGYVNLNHFQFDLSQYYYLHKSAKKKWDVQIGLRNYFSLNDQIWIPHKMELNAWKLAGRITTNFTYKNFIAGLFYEHDIRPNYLDYDRAAVFGLNLGVIY